MSDSAQHAGGSGAAVDVGGLIDAGAWSGYQKWIVFLVALTIIFDGIDNQLLGVAIPTLMAEWSVPRSAFAPVVSLGYLGMMTGGAIGGLVGDRLGRRTALLGSVILFGVMTVVAVLAASPTQMGILRMLAGIGLGGAMPNAAALAAEFVPLRKRPIAVTVTIVCVPLGATLAGLLGIRLLPLMGWRALFAVGGVVPIVAAILMMRALPESPRFLTRFPARWPELGETLRRMGLRIPGHATFADKTERTVAKVSVGTLFTPAFRADTVPLWVAFFSCLLAVYLCFSWLTSLLTSAGFAAGTANTGITAFNLGGVVGALCGGWAIARVGSRTAMLTMAALAIAGAVGLSLKTISADVPLVPIIVMLAFTGAMINGVQTTMFALAAHVYPSAVRATGVGTAVSFGRSGAIISGYAGAWTLEHGHGAFFGLVAASMAVSFVSLALVRRHVRTEGSAP
jgi:AAHS family 4-hydroxybenzoate transporter-like MFS transporter